MAKRARHPTNVVGDVVVAAVGQASRPIRFAHLVQLAKPLRLLLLKEQVTLAPSEDETNAAGAMNVAVVRKVVT